MAGGRKELREAEQEQGAGAGPCSGAKRELGTQPSIVWRRGAMQRRLQRRDKGKGKEIAGTRCSGCPGKPRPLGRDTGRLRSYGLTGQGARSCKYPHTRRGAARG